MELGGYLGLVLLAYTPLSVPPRTARRRERGGRPREGRRGRRRAAAGKGIYPGMESEEPPELAPGEGGASQAEMMEEEGEKNLGDQARLLSPLLMSSLCDSFRYFLELVASGKRLFFARSPGR